MQYKLDLPFIESRGFECGQTCAAMVLKYYYPDMKIDIDDLNRQIHFKHGTVTFPLQLAILLNKYGINATAYSSDNYPTLEEDPDIFKKWFGAEYDQLIKDVDFEAYDWMIKESRKSGVFKREITNFDEIINYLTEGKIVIFIVDWNTLVNQKSVFQGHSMILTGMEGNDLYVHDPDVGPFIKYSMKDLEKAYNHPAIADDIVVINGKK